MLDTLISFIEILVNLISLGTFADFNGLLPHVDPVLQATLIGWGLVAIKWVLGAYLLWRVLRWVLSKFDVRDYVIPTVATVILLLLIMVFVHSPIDDVQSTETRLTAWSYALTNTTNMDYSPSLLYPLIGFTAKPIEGVNDTANNLQGSIPNNAGFGFKFNTSNKLLGLIPVVEGDNWGIPAWVKLFVYAGLIGLCAVLIRFVSKLWGTIFLLIVLLLALGVEEASISAFILIIGMIVVTYLLLVLPRLEGAEFLTAYPVGIMVVCTLFLLHPPKFLLLIGLVFSFALFFFVFFYLFGLGLVALGALRGSRSKLGMKKKPTKEVEEYYGSYDAVVVGLILTVLFTAIIDLLGLTVFGLGVFMGSVVAIFRI